MDLDLLNTHKVQSHKSTAFTSLLIDSRDRDRARYPTPTEYTIDLPHTLLNVTEAKLMSAELPSSFYVFTYQAKNTILDLEVNGVRKQVVIPDGNYGFTTMTNALKESLESSFADEGHVFTVSTSGTTFKLTIEIEDPSLTMRLYSGDYVGDTTHWGLPYYLGFERNQVIESVSGVLQGTRPASLNPITYLLLDIEEFGRLHESEILGRGGAASTHTFAKVPVSVDSFKFAYFDKPITHNTFSPPIPRLRKLRISWRLHSGEPVDFQGLDHSMTLQLTYTPIQTY